METNEVKMIEGSKTYYLPNSDIEVDVFYSIEGDDIYFAHAEIESTELNCDVLAIQIDVTQPWQLVRQTKQITLKQWYQSKLEHDAADIFADNDIVVRSDYDEHYPAGLI